jgi:hypothetical protein
LGGGDSLLIYYGLALADIKTKPCVNNDKFSSRMYFPYIYIANLRAEYLGNTFFKVTLSLFELNYGLRFRGLRFFPEIEILKYFTPIPVNRLESLAPPFCYAIQDLVA